MTYAAEVHLAECRPVEALAVVRDVGTEELQIGESAIVGP